MELNQNISYKILNIYQIFTKENDMSLLSFVADYYNNLVSARDFFRNYVEPNELEQIVHSIVETYYLSGNFIKFEFSEYLEIYLRDLRQVIAVIDEQLTTPRGRH